MLAMILEVPIVRIGRMMGVPWGGGFVAPYADSARGLLFISRRASLAGAARLMEETMRSVIDSLSAAFNSGSLALSLLAVVVAAGALAMPLGMAAEVEPKKEVAVFAGGCFWGMENILRDIPGVLSTEVGYTGGKLPNPTYQQVCTGLTGHAEAVEITFNPDVVSYETLIDYFFRMHDPTTLNRQHNDIGTQYRSAIFYTSEEQKEIAEKAIAFLTEQKKFARPIVTKVTEASVFYPAEGY
ncbi:MAG: peptide-methionine (S)-S-oxide reductase MsrA, partial [Pirellulales bacterium]